MRYRSRSNNKREAHYKGRKLKNSILIIWKRRDCRNLIAKLQINKRRWKILRCFSFSFCLKSLSLSLSLSLSFSHKFLTSLPGIISEAIADHDNKVSRKIIDCEIMRISEISTF